MFVTRQPFGTVKQELQGKVCREVASCDRSESLLKAEKVSLQCLAGFYLVSDGLQGISGKISGQRTRGFNRHSLAPEPIRTLRGNSPIATWGPISSLCCFLGPSGRQADSRVPACGLSRNYLGLAYLQFSGPYPLLGVYSPFNCRAGSCTILYMEVSRISGPQNGPQCTMILTTGTPKKRAEFVETPIWT